MWNIFKVNNNHTFLCAIKTSKLFSNKQILVWQWLLDEAHRSIEFAKLYALRTRFRALRALGALRAVVPYSPYVPYSRA